MASDLWWYFGSFGYVEWASLFGLIWIVGVGVLMVARMSAETRHSIRIAALGLVAGGASGIFYIEGPDLPVPFAVFVLAVAYYVTVEQRRHGREAHEER